MSDSVIFLSDTPQRLYLLEIGVVFFNSVENMAWLIEYLQSYQATAELAASRLSINRIIAAYIIASLVEVSCS